MKKSILIVLLFIACFNIASAQKPYPTPTAEETKEARELAVRFYNRYNETQDIEPLIKEFFIKDFLTRLKFCRKTGECGGFARDFWGKDDKLVKLKAVIKDFRRSYSFSINYLYLFFRIVNHINIIQPDNLDKLEQLAADKIKNELKDKPELLKYGYFLSEDEEIETSKKTKTLAGFRKQMIEAEKLNTELRKLELKLRSKAEKAAPKAKLRFFPNDFRIDIEENMGLFFNYPEGTRMIEVWRKSDENDFIPFKIDLIKANGKLKVVAIYPPID
jgi:hypothetical protein